MHTRGEVHNTRYFQCILQIVERIYAAACGETPWEQTIAELCHVGKLDGGALSAVDLLERRRVVLASYGLGSPAEAPAMPGPLPGDPQLTDSVLRSMPGAVWHARQIMSDALPTARLLWTDRVHPDGWISWACAVVSRDERQVVCLEVFAGAGRASQCPDLDDLLRLLTPHLSRAWRLGRTSRSMLAMPSHAGSSSACHADAARAPDRAPLPGMARLRAEFGLTKAEARLALRLADGSSLASAAQSFNVKLTTIRSQLQQVFAKTGTSRQTELVAMLLSSGYGTRGPLWRENRGPRPAALAEPGS